MLLYGASLRHYTAPAEGPTTQAVRRMSMLFERELFDGYTAEQFAAADMPELPTAFQEFGRAPWPPEGGVPLRAGGAGTGPYGRLAADGLRYGPAFRGMRAAWRHGEELYADVALPEAVRASGPEADGPEFVLHPALFDAALHALALDGLVKDGSGAVGPAAAGLSLPFAFGGVRVHTTGVQRLRVRVGPGPDGQAAVELTDETGSPVATVRSLTLRPLPRTGPATADPVTGALHRTDWVPLTESVRWRAPVAMARWGVLGTAGTRLVDTLAPPGSGVAVYRGPAACDASAAVVVAPCPPPDTTGGARDQAAGLLRPVSAVRHPGFEPGEALPGTLDALVTAQAVAVRAAAAEGPLVLLGRSAGGWVAHAMAERLESEGAAPAAVVLVDTYPPGHGDRGQALSAMTSDMLRRAAEFASAGPDRVTAMAGYFELFSGWKPAPLACPTLYVRARDTPPGAEPAPDWSLPHAEVTVDGDHFTMLEEHARTTALAIHRWLGTGPV
ncbi:polyketide synthase dehydratase domain-containing protein [Streptomyces malaysiensis]|uniref:polyketide synthase dehydratase domain-containing protein n=1 Tax=Streptomyces malaysiensis TaxID=92644 RepID=UPI0036750AFD